MIAIASVSVVITCGLLLHHKYKHSIPGTQLFSIRRVWMISPPPRTRSFQSHSLCLYSDGRKL